MINILLFFIGSILLMYSRIMIAKYHSVFYYKGRKKGSNPIIEKWKDNIHILANQTWRSLFGALFCFSLIFFIPIYNLYGVLYSIGFTVLVSSIASYNWQKWINLGIGLPIIDPNEKPKHEYIIFGKSWWLPKFWYGKRRKYISIASTIIFIMIIIHEFYLFLS